MKVNYINADVQDDFVRCTFIGFDKRGRTRRPVIDLDTSDLRCLIELAKEFRGRQKRLATLRLARVADITGTGLTETQV